MAFIGSTLRSTEFTVGKNQATGLVTLVAEASECPHAFGMLYDDAIDIGFGLESRRTGKVELFARDDGSTLFSFEGEVLAWVFRPVKEALQDQIQVVIWND